MLRVVGSARTPVGSDGLDDGFLAAGGCDGLRTGELGTGTLALSAWSASTGCAAGDGCEGLGNGDAGNSAFALFSWSARNCASST